MGGGRATGNDWVTVDCDDGCRLGIDNGKTADADDQRSDDGRVVIDNRVVVGDRWAEPSILSSQYILDNLAPQHTNGALMPNLNHSLGTSLLPPTTNPSSSQPTPPPPVLLPYLKPHQNPSPSPAPFPRRRALGFHRQTDWKRLLGLCVIGVGELEIGEEVLGDTLDGVEVFGLDGKGVVISDLWKDRRAVVAFARHFGCVLCRKRAHYLGAKKEQMDASGVALILIGPGTVEQAKSFSQQTKFEGEIYADPNHASYEALRFISGASTTFTPKAGLKIIESYMEGYRQDWKLSFEKHTVQRGGWQQGGILVAGPGKSNISCIHRDTEAGDDPPIEDVLKACCT
ncbi:Thioredoxin-like protein [Drosera capensis]